jgi:hypothetical protein
VHYGEPVEASPPVLAALIALVGVALSAVIAWSTSRKTLGVEIQKLRVQLQQAYATELIEMRITTYPELYSYLSDLSKNAKRRVPSLSELETLRDSVDSWDSKNAIFLGKDTVNICHEFRMVLAQAIVDAADGRSAHASRGPEWLSKLLGGGRALKLGLRGDLGLYGFVAKEDIETSVPIGW